MKTIQMTLDEDLVAQVDRIVKNLKTTRSAFTRDALRKAVESVSNSMLERQHRKGYQKKPVKKEEVEIWEDEQAWGDE